MNDYYILEDNVRNTFMSVVWAHKIQEKQVNFLIPDKIYSLR